MANDAFTTAMTNRSIRTIKAELEFLTSVNAVSEQQLASLLTNLPQETVLDNAAAAAAAPTQQMSNLNVRTGTNSFSEKREPTPSFQPSPSPVAQPPPAYPNAPNPPAAPLTYATALYAYTATDAGDLNLAPNERVAVTEYMNAEWWKGRSEKTGQEGIFPRSYVRADEKFPAAQPQPSNYGNMPLDVSQSGSGPADPKAPNKGQEMGKKFGKKLGNAAIFGAGATIGGNIVNSIF